MKDEKGRQVKVIGIVGTRSRNTQKDYLVVARAFHRIYEIGDEIVSGGCPQGGDRFAESLARSNQCPIKIYYAEWNRLGKRAGFARNGYIVRDADYLIACVSADRTGGTEDTVSQFLKKIDDYIDNNPTTLILV